MRVLILDTASNCLDFAMRCQIAGHRVLWWDKPYENGKQRRSGEGLIEKIRDFNEIKAKWIDAADLIYVPDNVQYIPLLEQYRQRGYPIFNANMAAAKLEVDREAGQVAMRKAGLETIPGKTFHDYGEAIRYVEKEGKAFVSKPSGDADKALSYVANDAGDMIFMLERWNKNPEYRKMAKKDGFILQEKIDGIEMAVGGYFGPHGWNEVFFENFEYKKLFTGDLGMNTGEMGCYDPETEILTRNGWKFWPDVTIDDELATLLHGKTVFQKPKHVVSYDVDTELIGWKNQTIDVLVTPNHQMYVEKQASARSKNDKYEFILAENCTDSQYAIKRTAEWDGVLQGPHVFHSVRAKVDFHIDEMAFAKLCGIYVAEGCLSTGGIQISASHPRKMPLVENILKETGLPYRYEKSAFVIGNAELHRHFSPLGTALFKHVPDYIKNSTKEVISAFLDAYGLGDGNMQPNGFRVFYTSSRKLAGDIQELLLKIGRTGVMKIRQPRAGNKIGDRLVKSDNVQYEVIERIKKTRSWLDLRDRYTVPYSGKVYCAEVDGHVLFVRRNGKPFWCGNTAVRATKRSKLADLVLKPFTAQLHALGYVGFVDNAVMIGKTDGKIYPLELTISRDGWPIRHNIQSLLASDLDPAQWMLDLINGMDSLRVKEGMTSISVVVPLPPFPYQHVVGKDVDGVPLYDATDMTHVHLSEARLAKDVPVVVDGKIVRQPNLVATDVYPMVVTGVGKTINKAREDAYAAVKKVRIPNSPFYRIDIGNGRLMKQLPILKKHGFAKDWTM